ncbi:OsmC/Ohr family [Irpex rosettiformis]|uniref:OsmC/Ohr family n=1 Tax=Irpex rosettiformis TaxID=378272 RepID=A0ACB8TS92_9APHY|nr:OsmC/Ohr family [Irpex rosettiformis]
MNITKVLRQSYVTRRMIQGAAGRYFNGGNPIHSRGIITLKDHLFFEKATASGAGRHGNVESFGDSALKLKMSMPKAAGGKGDGQNPEQLFAMGYATCFLGALQLQASRAGKKEAAEVAKVSAKVFLGHPDDASMDGFGIRAEIIVENFDDDAIIQAAHEFCPYSRALTHGADVKVSKA